MQEGIEYGPTENWLGKHIRSVIIDGDPWVFAVDIARCTGARDSYDVMKYIDSDDTHQVNITQLPDPGAGKSQSYGQTQYYLSGTPLRWVISLPGLFTYLGKGRTEYAREFMKWATREMLPNLFRYGYYRIDEGPMKEMADAIVVLQAEVEVLRAMQEIGMDGTLRDLIGYDEQL